MTRGDAAPARTSKQHTVIRTLNTLVNAIIRQIDADLQREHQLSRTEYIALDSLYQAPDCTLMLSDLAAGCQQSLSATSRTVGRLQAQGLVRREQSTRDARAHNAVLTEAGLKRYHEATPTHDNSMWHYLLHHLDGIDLDAFGDALQRIIAAVCPDISCDNASLEAR